MAHITEDRILESSTTTGTGAFTLAGAVTGFRTFASVMAVNDTCWYAIWGVDGQGTPTGQFESGLGTYSALNTLTRTTVLESSAAGAAVTFSAGTKYVAITLTANKTMQLDNVGATDLPTVSAEPTNPATGVKLYTSSSFGDDTLKIKRSYGTDSPLQQGIAFNRIQKWQASAAGVQAIGGAATLVGTGTNITPTSGSAKTSVPRIVLTMTNAAGNFAAIHAGAVANAFPYFRGGVAGEGGFLFNVRFSLQTLGTGNRGFWGLYDVIGAPTNIDPTTNTTPGKIGLAFNTNTGNWRFVNNITGTAPTSLDLGANFPIDTTSLMELVLFARPFTTVANNIQYRIRRFTTSSQDPAFETVGTLTTNIPAATTILQPTLWMTNNATAGTLVWHFTHMAMEADW